MLFLANLSGCHAKIPSASFFSMLATISLKISLPGSLAVLLSTNSRTIFRFSFLAYSRNSNICASILKTCLSPLAKEKRLVCKISFCQSFALRTSALPSGRFRSPSKMLGFWRGNTMPRRNAPRQLLTIFLKVQIGGVFWTKFELSLSKPPTKEASPATARQARHTTEKYSLLFSFCARRIFSSLNEKSIFLWCFALTSKAAGLASIFCKNTAEFPPHPLPPCSCGDGRDFWRRYFIRYQCLILKPCRVHY